jgi:hypothetical protein
MALRHALIPSLLLAGAVAFGCSAAGDKPGDTLGGGGNAGGAGAGDFNAKELSIEPADATIEATSAGPATLAYKAIAKNAAGEAKDLTDIASFSADIAGLGSFEGAVFTAASGASGATAVRAEAAGLVATTTLTIQVASVIIEPGAPADAPALFGGQEGGAAPALVYPANNVLVPPNLRAMEFHFMPGAGNTVFELGLKTDALALKVYLVCTPAGQGCAYTPSDEVWKAMSTAGRGGPPVKYTLRGVNGQSPGAVGASEAQNLSFGQEDIVGGLYYWNAGAGQTIRVEFGKPQQTADKYMTAQTAGASTCVGCHVLSRDGTRIAEGLDIPGGAYKVFDVPTKTPFYAQGSMFGGGASYFSFSPDAKQILTSNGSAIVLRNADTGAAISDPLIAKGSMPDWSPDGKTIVYARYSADPMCFGGFCPPGVDSAGLETISFDGTTWGASSVLVPYSGQNNYYPAFSADGKWVIYNRSPGNQNSFDAKDPQVWVVPREGGAPIQLALASTGGDSWPKWTTVVQAYQSGELLWFTFSSRREYGLKLANGAQSQIWMAAFDPKRAQQGKDPSFAAFWLPFQDIASGNHIAQWVEKVVKKPCATTADCPADEVCEEGDCQPGVN